ncbi:hypothetical protein GCM10009416_24210 [Craurococcus roseus]|uniref:Uncharacterized protein n=1 Tax=Craurococcus roseus TaxID=77585 RepID=A0ABP3Q803_9PROT
MAADSAASKAAGTGPAGATHPLSRVASNAAISPPVRWGGERSTWPTGRARSAKSENRGGFTDEAGAEAWSPAAMAKPATTL